ncbi:hypothetical protein GCM10010207_72340 [Streptomyces atratus]|uniref:hypothetical protein n=1 Tax=Streptomyces atratus TaxID=1893 RepID=UPI00167127CB|nr:hypothetical protein [Streptomyces atratus]GGT62271.1 hypothetical protein GCM10010207_72340 [Streptomyces atratus]
MAANELLMPGRAAALTGASESGAVLFAALACAGFIRSGIGSRLAPPAARVAGGGERAVMVSTGASGLLLLGATAASTKVGSVALAANSSVPADVGARPAEHPEPSARGPRREWLPAVTRSAAQAVGSGRQAARAV